MALYKSRIIIIITVLRGRATMSLRCGGICNKHVLENLCCV